jgi:Skp family chaperone for outer membrane proteins
MNQALKVIVVILAFVGIFLAGAVTGGVVIAIVSKGRMQLVQHERQLEHVQHQMEQQERQMEKQQFTQLVGVLRQQLQQQQQLRQQPPSGPMQQGQRRPPAPEQFGPQLMQRFTNQIRPPLTPDERATIRPLVNQTAEDLRRLRRDTTNKTEAMLEHLQDQISAVLTPAQRDHFSDLIERWRDAFQKYNAEQQQRQALQRATEQQMQQRRQQQMQQQAPAGSPPPAAAPSSAPATPPPPAPAPAG